MSWLDGMYMDLNDDGVVDNYDAGIMTMHIMDMQDDAVRKERIDTMFSAICRSGETSIDNTKFEKLCEENNLSIEDFEQRDIEELQRRMDDF